VYGYFVLVWLGFYYSQVFKTTFRELVEMASTACFVIVSKDDIPIYEAEVGSAPKVWLFQFIPSSVSFISVEIPCYVVIVYL